LKKDGTQGNQHLTALNVESLRY